MNWGKYLLPVFFASIMAGCSFTGGNAPISDGPTTASVYTVKPGDTLYAISSRYGLDPTVVARENNLSNPSQLFVGQKLKLSVSSTTAANINRVAVNSRSNETVSKPAASETSSQKTVTSSESSPSSPAAAAVKTSGTYSWPASGKVIENFGGLNKGIDIAGKEGESVRAATDGTVLFVGNVQGYGNVAMVRDKAGCVSVYGRAKTVKVKQGQAVKKNQEIAVMGTTDKSPRVHFEIRKNGKPIDPLTMLEKR